MPFIKLDEDTIQRLLESDDMKEEMQKVVAEAEASDDPSRVQNTLKDVIREIKNSPDIESHEVN